MDARMICLRNGFLILSEDQKTKYFKMAKSGSLKYRDRIRRYVKKAGLTVINADSFIWNPNE